VRIAALFAAACAATLALALPRVLAGGPLLPDPVEYLGIAWSWVSGAGFVDPVLYSYYLPHTAPPVPALVMRAPVVPILLAAPLALGASLRAVLVLHAVFAATIGAAGVFVARRLDGRPAAAAYAIGFCLAYPWLVATQLPLTEAASAGMLLALAACAPRALANPRPAALFGALAALAWLTRPNLALAAPVFAATAAIVLGPRAALRSPALWTALGVFVAIEQGVTIACRAATGFPPYEHYKVLLETTGAGEAFYFQKQWVGWTAWLAAHGPEARAALRMNAVLSARLLFTLPDYHYVGWAAVPALVDAFRRRDDRRPLRIFLALLALALLAVHFASWGAIDPRRLLVPAALCLWLLAAGWLAHAARRLPAAALASAAPALLCLAAWGLSPSASGTAGLARRAWDELRAAGPRSGLEASAAPSFCAALDRDAIVASPHPWDLYLACGNAGWVLPRDLDGEAVLDRYLDAAAPGYLVVPADQVQRFAGSPRLERLAAAHGHVLFAVRDAGARSRPWAAPPPLVGAP
jgi:hypothetical protein